MSLNNAYMTVSEEDSFYIVGKLKKIIIDA